MEVIKGVLLVVGGIFGIAMFVMAGVFGWCLLEGAADRVREVRRDREKKGVDFVPPLAALFAAFLSFLVAAWVDIQLHRISFLAFVLICALIIGIYQATTRILFERPSLILIGSGLHFVLAWIVALFVGVIVAHLSAADYFASIAGLIAGLGVMTAGEKYWNWRNSRWTSHVQVLYQAYQEKLDTLSHTEALDFASRETAKAMGLDSSQSFYARVSELLANRRDYPDESFKNPRVRELTLLAWTVAEVSGLLPAEARARESAWRQIQRHATVLASSIDKRKAG